MSQIVQPKKTKRDLLEKGLEILAESGVEGLTIDALCGELGVTKGSFYHHFKGRSKFHAALLEFWMEEHTERKKSLADEEGTPEERYARIVQYAATLPHDLEKTIRAWAMHDPLAAQYQARVDESRHMYLSDLLETMSKNRAVAEVRARIVLSVMVGSRHLFPPILGKTRQDMMHELHSLMGIELPECVVD